MKFKHRQFGFQMKSIEKDGSFAGYGSVFGNADYYRDVVMPGAFAKSLAAWKQRDTLPPVLWQHNSRQPIGPFTSMVEDGKGLYVEGQLLIDDVQQAREAYALMKSKTINGMSIGYEVTEETLDGKINRLTGIDLWEVSIVTFPANTDATVTQLKSIVEAGDTPTIREFERHLREQGGFSRNQAEEITRFGYAKFLEQRDAGRGNVENEDFNSLLTLIRENPIQLQ